jgi:hypothetical protein
MLRSKSCEIEIVQALEKMKEKHGNAWVIIETCGRLKSVNDTVPFEKNFILFIIGDIFPSVHLMTDVVVTSPAVSTIRLQEAYIGLPDYTHTFFGDPQNIGELSVKVEYDKKQLLLHLAKDGTDIYNLGEDLYKEIPELAAVCTAARVWFEKLCSGNITNNETDDAIKENDVVHILGRNRKIYKMGNGQLCIIHQGKKISLEDARKMEKDGSEKGV